MVDLQDPVDRMRHADQTVDVAPPKGEYATTEDVVTLLHKIREAGH